MTKNEQLATLFLNDSGELLDQSMKKLENCLRQLSVEQIWQRQNGSTNSVGNIVLHICGNLLQWSVAGVGGHPDTRDREREFSDEHALASDELLVHLQHHIRTCKEFLATLNSEKLAADYTIQGFQVNGLQAINHTVTHFVGHTHQIIYITRLILGEAYELAWSPVDSRDQLPI